MSGYAGLRSDNFAVKEDSGREVGKIIYSWYSYGSVKLGLPHPKATVQKLPSLTIWALVISRYVGLAFPLPRLPKYFCAR